jgi:hypothetical protein
MPSQSTERERQFIDRISWGKGKSGGWPEYFDYHLGDGQLEVKLTKADSGKKEYRGLDPWALAVVTEARKAGLEIGAVSLIVAKGEGPSDPDFEALRRRVSYLSINNRDIRFELIHERKPAGQEHQYLYSQGELFNRPEEEKVRKCTKDMFKRSHGGKEDSIEKAFQKFLGLDDGDNSKTNERLAVLGDDFFKTKGRGVVREFPTGAFRNAVSEPNRILPTEFVDIVTFNKSGILSVIELKLNDTQLEVISQILDYSLFFRCYIDHEQPWGTIRSTILKELGRKSDPDVTRKAKQEIACYVVNNRFHERFDEVAAYYGTAGRSYGFTMNKVVLGYTNELRKQCS